MRGTPYHFLCLLVPVALSSCGPGSPSNPAPVLLAIGTAWVASLPKRDGLQFCAHVRPDFLASRTAHNAFVHSLSAFITSTDASEPALLAIKGRYPGWDTPGTTVYQQPFTSSNTVWLEIDHEFPDPGMDCIEVYGSHVRPSEYSQFRKRILVSYSYFWHGHGWSATKFIPVSWGRYLARYSPRHRPKH